MSDELTLRYIPLSQAALWDRNPKLHDIGGIVTSIKRHGFKDPPKFEPKLNNGSGGLGEGNGRIIVLRMMQQDGEPLPRGIKFDGSDWLVPILFGVDAESEAAAEAYAVDHNNLTMAGGDFTAFDIAGMWDPARYTPLLAELATLEQLPVTVDGEALDAMVLKNENVLSGEEKQINSEFMILIECKNEQEQVEILERLINEGLNCRALLS